MKISRRHNIILILLILLISVRIFAGDSGEKNKVKELNLNDFRIYISKNKYIALDMSHEDVENNFGKPLKVIVDKNSINNKMDEFKFEYEGLHLYFYREEDKVNYVSVKGSEYYTSRGVHVGDPVNKVRKEYIITDEFDDGSLLSEYYTVDGTLRVFYITFQVKDNHVIEITLEIPTDI